MALALLALGGACASTAGDTEKAERIARRFLETRFMTDEGGVFTSSTVRRWLFVRYHNLEQMRLSGILSESAGLLMRYAVLAGDRAMFDRQLAFVKRRLTGQFGLYFWKIGHDGELTADSSASVDDLRIIGACLDAAERFGEPAYRAYALEIAAALREHEVIDDHLRDFVNWRDWGEPSVARSVQLSYLDLPTIARVADLAPAFRPVAESAARLLAGGRLATGLYYEQYDFARARYTGTKSNTINQLYCGLFDRGHEAFADFLAGKLAEDGVIYAEYDAASGEATKFYESTSVYALATRFFLAAGREDEAETTLRRMLDFQGRAPLSPMYGAFADDEVYSFDNLEALLTLRAWNARAAN
ncbi:hypothetical protein K8I61_09985 [bacterium]|nr:hypothetical protein [bacterium]